MLSKRYYKEFAVILKDVLTDVNAIESVVISTLERGVVRRIVSDFERFLIKDNPNFDKGRFEEAVYKGIKK